MRLIDADSLKRMYSGNGTFTEAHFRTAIDEQPTVDTVAVVRCEQCRYWGKDGFGDYRKCSIDGAWHRCSFWCAGGERKAEATES